MPLRNDPREEPTTRRRVRLRNRPAAAAAPAVVLPGPFSHSPGRGGGTCDTRAPSLDDQ